MTEPEFERVCCLCDEHTGIDLSLENRNIVFSRLIGRLREYDMAHFGQYLEFIGTARGQQELGIFIDKMTTHVTGFFREPEHFEFLHKYWMKRNQPSRKLSAWSAACASGEEAYSIGMVLDDIAGDQNWHVLGTDVSPVSVAIAQQACYPLSVSECIPPEWRNRYCLRGAGGEESWFIIRPQFKDNLTFLVDNLLCPSSGGHQFDVVFLCNVLSYFSDKRQRQVLDNVIQRLRRSGLLIAGDAKTLCHHSPNLNMLQPGVYRKVA